MSPALIIQLRMVMQHAWRICPPISRCPSPAKHLPVSLTVESGLRAPHSHMTGAPVPAGCEAVVMQEQTEQTDDGVRFTADVRCGQTSAAAARIFARCGGLLPAGTRLTTAELPVLSLELPMRRLMQARSAAPTGDEPSFRASRWSADKFMTLTV